MTSLNSLDLTETQLEEAKEAVRRMAYDKWQEAGCPEGDSDRFWREAEQEWIGYHYVPPRYPDEEVETVDARTRPHGMRGPVWLTRGLGNQLSRRRSSVLPCDQGLSAD